ncbi:hypothetical protein OEZ86_014645 [Tetradesmus obliquus]|nr:hypothetical protein OEZ86_014645 [Tetradesmus obliquus]
MSCRCEFDQGWPKPNRRDLIAAGVGSLIGGAAMFVYDTLVINNLYDEIDDLEDELELAAEEAYLTEAAIEDADAADAAGGTMEDLEKK